MSLTKQEKEVLVNLTESICSHLEASGILRIADDKLIIYKSIKEKDPQNIFIMLMKEHADSYGIPYEEDERKFIMTAKDFNDFYVCNRLSTN